MWIILTQIAIPHYNYYPVQIYDKSITEKIEIPINNKDIHNCWRFPVINSYETELRLVWNILPQRSHLKLTICQKSTISLELTSHQICSCDTQLGLRNAGLHSSATAWMKIASDARVSSVTLFSFSLSATAGIKITSGARAPSVLSLYQQYHEWKCWSSDERVSPDISFC